MQTMSASGVYLGPRRREAEDIDGGNEMGTGSLPPTAGKAIVVCRGVVSPPAWSGAEHRLKTNSGHSAAVRKLTMVAILLILKCSFIQCNRLSN